jgi:hypothetical protein
VTLTMTTPDEIQHLPQQVRVRLLHLLAQPRETSILMSTTVLLLPEFLPDFVEDDAVVLLFNDLQVVVRTPRPRTLLRTDRAETADHLAMYGFAATRARGMALDLDSGVGCGAAVIAAAQSVTFLIAFDISSPTLAFGKGSYSDTISFVAGDAGAFALLQGFPR